VAALWNVENAAGVPVYLVLTTIVAFPIASIVALWIAPRMLSQMRAFFGKSTRIVIVILGTFLAVSCPYLIWALLKSGMQIGSWWELLLWYLAFFVTPVPFVSIVAFELTSRRQLQ
jgi:hypothetical protein